MNQGSVDLSANTAAPPASAGSANNGIFTAAGNVFQLGEPATTPQAGSVLTANRTVHTGQFIFGINQLGLTGNSQPKSFVSNGTTGNECFAFRDHINTNANTIPTGNQTLITLMGGTAGSNVNCGIDAQGNYPSNYDGIRVSNQYAPSNAAARVLLNTNHGFMIFQMSNTINNTLPGASIYANSPNGLKIINDAGNISFNAGSTTSERMRIFNTGLGNVAIGLPYADNGERLQVQGNVTLQHLQTKNVSGNPPTIALDMGAAGAGATANISGTDTAGTIIITVGSNPDYTINRLATVSLNTAFYGRIIVFLSHRNSYNNSVVNPPGQNLGNAGADLITAIELNLTQWVINQNGILPLIPGQSLNFNYLCVDIR